MFTTARLQLNHDRLPEPITGYRDQTIGVRAAGMGDEDKEARVVVLNDVAQRIIDGVRGQHPPMSSLGWIARVAAVVLLV